MCIGIFMPWHTRMFSIQIDGKYFNFYVSLVILRLENCFGMRISGMWNVTNSCVFACCSEYMDASIEIDCKCSLTHVFLFLVPLVIAQKLKSLVRRTSAHREIHIECFDYSLSYSWYSSDLYFILCVCMVTCVVKHTQCVEPPSSPCQAGSAGPDGGPCTQCVAGKYKIATDPGVAACAKCGENTYKVEFSKVSSFLHLPYDIL